MQRFKDQYQGQEQTLGCFYLRLKKVVANMVICLIILLHIVLFFCCNLVFDTPTEYVIPLRINFNQDNKKVHFYGSRKKVLALLDQLMPNVFPSMGPKNLFSWVHRYSIFTLACMMLLLLISLCFESGHHGITVYVESDISAFCVYYMYFESFNCDTY